MDRHPLRLSRTFRYPTYGGVETTTLDLPVNREIEFHVTSLDVVHSFWAVELGVKADAVLGADNVAFDKPWELGSFQVRCDADGWAMARPHEHHRAGPERFRVHDVDHRRGAQERRGDQEAAAVLPRVLPIPPTECVLTWNQPVSL